MKKKEIERDEDDILIDGFTAKQLCDALDDFSDRIMKPAMLSMAWKMAMGIKPESPLYRLPVKRLAAAVSAALRSWI